MGAFLDKPLTDKTCDSQEGIQLFNARVENHDGGLRVSGVLMLRIRM